MVGGSASPLRWLVPRYEIDELDRLVLLLETQSRIIDFADVDAREDVGKIFETLATLEVSSRRIRDRALLALLGVPAPQRPTGLRSYDEVGQVAGVSQVHLERMVELLRTGAVIRPAAVADG